MKNTCPLYTVSRVSKLLLIMIYRIPPPSSFISYLLFYIFLFNRFTQSDHVVSCTKKNLHHRYPLHLQNWNALKYTLKEVWGYLSFDFWSGTTKPSIPQAQPKLFASLKASISSTFVSRFSMIVVSGVAGWCFLTSSLATSVKTQLLYYL